MKLCHLLFPIKVWLSIWVLSQTLSANFDSGFYSNLDLGFGAGTEGRVLSVAQHPTGVVAWAGAVERSYLADRNLTTTGEPFLQAPWQNSPFIVTFTSVDGVGGFGGVFPKNARISTSGLVRKIIPLELGPFSRFLILGNFDEVFSNQFSSPGSYIRQGAAIVHDNGLVEGSFFLNGPDGTNGDIWDAVEMPDGTFILGGSFTTLFGQSGYTAVARVDRRGAIDTSLTAIPFNSGAIVRDILRMPDGSIIFAGTFTIPGTFFQNIAKLDPSGALDLTFLGQDSATTARGLDGPVYALDRIYTDEIVIGGDFTQLSDQSGNHSCNDLIAIFDDGTLSGSFQTGSGFSNTDRTGLIPSSIRQIQALADGSVVVAGAFDEYDGEIVDDVARLDQRGNLLPGFTGTDVNKSLSFIDSRDSGLIDAMCVLGDERILIGGEFDLIYSREGFSKQARNLARLNINGGFDSQGYMTAQLATPPIYKPNGPVHAILPRANGEVMLGGSFDGFQDESTTIPFGGLIVTEKDRDGRLLFAWSNGAGGVGSPAIIDAIVEQDDGKIIIGGAFDSWNDTDREGGIQPVAKAFVIRLNSDYTYDESFQPVVNGRVRTIVISQEESAVYLGGDFDSINTQPCTGLAKVNLADGTTFPGFTPPEMLAREGTGVGSIHALCLTPELESVPTGGLKRATLVVGGDFKVEDTSGTRFNLVRLDPTGYFAPTSWAGFGTNGTVRAIEWLPGNQRGDQPRILVGGDFTGFAGNSVDRLVLTTNSGVILSRSEKGTNAYDSLFQDGGVYTFAVQSSGHIWVGGNFDGFISPETEQVVGGRGLLLFDPNNVQFRTFRSHGDVSISTGSVQALAIDRYGAIYVGGDFPSLDVYSWENNLNLVTTIDRANIFRLTNHEPVMTDLVKDLYPNSVIWIRRGGAPLVTQTEFYQDDTPPPGYALTLFKDWKYPRPNFDVFNGLWGHVWQVQLVPGGYPLGPLAIQARGSTGTSGSNPSRVTGERWFTVRRDFENWLFANYELTDPIGEGDENSTPPGSPLSNVIRYSGGMTGLPFPRSVGILDSEGRAPFAEAISEDGGALRLSLTFRRDPTAAESLRYLVIATDNLDDEEVLAIGEPGQPVTPTTAFSSTPVVDISGDVVTVFDYQTSDIYTTRFIYLKVEQIAPD